MSRKFVEIDADWEALFPGKIFKAGAQSINIMPLTVEQITGVVRQIKVIMPELKKEGISMKNLMDSDNVATTVSVIVDKVPGLMSDITGIGQASINKMPLAALVDLFNCALEANIESKEVLEKNFEKLAAMIAKLSQEPTTEEKEVQTE